SRQGGGSGWTLDIIRSYISWARSRPAPVMTPEAERVLVAYYGAMRRAEERSAARSTIRALESLIRVSQVPHTHHSFRQSQYVPTRGQSSKQQHISMPTLSTTLSLPSTLSRTS
ncbi:hypothetical protein Agub_g9788, partial [Astrephomene gubernaculifera]